MQYWGAIMNIFEYWMNYTDLHISFMKQSEAVSVISDYWDTEWTTIVLKSELKDFGLFSPKDSEY